ncbi:MAG: type II toxin-antitoxin system RelB/DinJ family antitoxin [Pseudomonadota bacterium]
MSKTAFIRARIEPELKNDVESILKELGISTSQMLTMLYKKIRRDKEIPIDLHIPNKETAKAIAESRKGKNVVACKDADDMFERLDI